jgi:hypothetical protein
MARRFGRVNSFARSCLRKKYSAYTGHARQGVGVQHTRQR